MEDMILKQIGADVFVSLENLKEFYKNLNDQLATKKFNASQIIETETKKFISQALITKLESNVYTKEEVFTKTETTAKIEEVKNLVSGISFKGVYQTVDQLPTEGAQDGWLAIVTNDPAVGGVNHLYIYETAELQKAKAEAGTGKWVKLDDIMVPGLATADKDGLLSKEDKKKIDGMQNAINQAKQEAIGQIDPKIATAKQEITAAYQKADQVIDQKVTKIDTEYKAADTQINQKITTIEGAYKEADKVVEGKITELENKIKFATKAQIDAIFTAPQV